MTPTASRTGIPADLIERVHALTPEQREELSELIDLADMPPDTRTPEEWKEELKRRIEEAESGAVRGLTREEAAEQIRIDLRTMYGFEL
jgi:putative addiction module component (TIGR02574 family)